MPTQCVLDCFKAQSIQPRDVKPSGQDASQRDGYSDPFRRTIPQTDGLSHLLQPDWAGGDLRSDNVRGDHNGTTRRHQNRYPAAAIIAMSRYIASRSVSCSASSAEEKHPQSMWRSLRMPNHNTPTKRSRSATMVERLTKKSNIKPSPANTSSAGNPIATGTSKGAGTRW